MSAPCTPWRFEIPWPRPALRLRAILGVLAFAILVGRAAFALQRDPWGVFAFALVAAAAFLLAAVTAWRRLRTDAHPVVLDARGLAVDDGLGNSWFVTWEEIERVSLRRGFLRRWVVIHLRSGEPPLRLVHPALHYGLPPQWLAGLIETFRSRFTGRREDSAP